MKPPFAPLLSLVLLSSASVFGATTAVNLTYPVNSVDPDVVTNETLSGAGTLGSPNNSGDHTGTVYTVTSSFVGTLFAISFDVSVTSGGGVIHFDNRGFGDSGGTNDAFQNNTSEVLTFDISAPTITPLHGPPGAAAGYIREITGTVTFGLLAFEVHDNGGSRPRVDYSTDDSSAAAVSFTTLQDNGQAFPGSLSAASNSTSGQLTSPGVNGGSPNNDNIRLDFPALSATSATQIVVTASQNWSWVNNAAFSFDADLRIVQVPEPSRVMLLGLAVLGVLMRRRR